MTFTTPNVFVLLLVVALAFGGTIDALGFAIARLDFAEKARGYLPFVLLIVVWLAVLARIGTRCLRGLKENSSPGISTRYSVKDALLMLLIAALAFRPARNVVYFLGTVISTATFRQPNGTVVGTDRPEYFGMWIFWFVFSLLWVLAMILIGWLYSKSAQRRALTSNQHTRSLG